MKKVLGIGLVILVGAGCLVHAAVHSRNVVGFQTVSIVGGAETTYTLISVPMTKIPEYRGEATSGTGTSLVDTNASWTAGEFAAGVTGKEDPAGSASTYYVEITEPGALEGRHFYVVNNTADTLTLATTAGAVDLTGASYKVIAANRVRDIFGELGSSPLTPGGAPAVADNVLIWNPASGWSTPVYLKNSGPAAQQGWKQGTAAASDLVVDRDEGMLIKREAGGANADLTITGEVSDNLQAIVVEGDYSLVGGMSSVNKTLSEAGLEPPVLAGGGAPAVADNILEWDPASGWLAPIYYKTTGPAAQQGWKRGTTSVGDTFVFEAGKAYLFKVGSTTEWTRESPL